MLFLLGSLLAASNILIYPDVLQPDGYGDRASNLLMIYNIKKILGNNSKIYLYLDNNELKINKFSILLGIEFNENMEYPIKIDPTTLSFVVNQDNPDFIVITGFELIKSNKYDISLCFSRMTTDRLYLKEKHHINPLFENQYTLDFFLNIDGADSIPAFVFPEFLSKNYLPSSESLQYPMLYPHCLNYLYVSRDSLIPECLNENDLRNIFLSNVADKKILATYFNSFNVNDNTIIYLISMYRDMTCNEKYYWYHNSDFKSLNDLKKFFIEKLPFYKDKKIIKIKDVKKFIAFLEKTNIVLINQSLNLLQSAVLFKIADFPVGCTGDVSLSLALRYAKYIPVYDVVSWKREFLIELLNSFRVSYINLNASQKNKYLDIRKNLSGDVFVENTFIEEIRSLTFTDLVVKCIHNITKELKE
jgi:hypothetical protein